jgi:purine-binding chemotaxis protein CheW
MAQTNQYLTFMIGAEKYAFVVDHIREVLIVPKVTVIPRMPEYMGGVINVRGAVVPVLDLGLKFGLSATLLTKDTAIIVVEIPTGDEGDSETFMHVGIYADSVEKVIMIEPSQIEPPPRIGLKINTAFIAGMGHVDDSFIVILDINEILTNDELEPLEAISAQAES